MGALNIFGLMLSLAGILILFRYGMPYRLPFPSEPILGRPKPGDHEELARYKRLGWIGLTCTVFGTLLQGIVAVWTLPFWSWP